MAMQKLKNIFSYLRYVFSLDLFQLISAVIDLAILCWSIICWRDIAFQPSILLVVLGVLINFLWQLLNLLGHFSFLKREVPGRPLVSMIEGNSGKDFSLISVEPELKKCEMPYAVDYSLGVLDNEAVSTLLRDKNVKIELLLSKTKEQDTRAYIMQYKDTLLKFLNHKWYDVNHNGGDFTNDVKICFASEIFKVGDSYQWRITKGCYYNGYLTNTIYTKYVGGDHYTLYPPMNVTNKPIGSLGGLDFSDHIGVSTLLYTTDGYVLLFKQAGHTAQYANKYMPSGSGSLDYADLKPGMDLRQLIVCGVERELREESSLKKISKSEIESLGITIKTIVLRFYRDMERGGKPEFCCISLINKPKDYVVEYISPNIHELANDKSWKRLDDDVLWQEKLLPQASLSLKMNYLSAKSYLIL